MDHSLVTTGFEVIGHRLVKSLGMVRGIIVRSRSIFGTFGASLQQLIGGNITLCTDLCERTRADAYELMIRHAEMMGSPKWFAMERLWWPNEWTGKGCGQTHSPILEPPQLNKNSRSLHYVG